MGYENREYFRDGSYLGGRGGFLDEAPMCKWILIVTVAVFILQMFWMRPAQQSDFQRFFDQYEQVGQNPNGTGDIFDDRLIDGPEQFADGGIGSRASVETLLQTMPSVSVPEAWLKLDTDKVIKGGQVWRLITCAFCHDRFGVWHILINMVLLYWFGRFVESTYGSREFLIFYLTAAVVGSLAFIGLELAVEERGSAIGASGAMMAVFCVFALWNPTYTIRMNFIFPIQVQYLLLIYVLYDLHPVLLRLSGSEIYTGVGHAAHLGGLLFGFLYFKNNWQLAPYWNRLVGVFGGNQKSAKRVRSATILPFSNAASTEEPVVEKTKADLRFDDQVDEILKKIHEEGKESLTDRERKILNLGSQRYKDR